MTLTQIAADKVVTKLLLGQDYRIEIVSLIESEFLQYAVDFFKKVVYAKLEGQKITKDWYKNEFLDPKKVSLDEIIINSGLNKKTISNMYNSAKKEIVLEICPEYYDNLAKNIDELTKIEDLSVELKLELNSVSVKLDLNETLIVVNTLAVKRAAIRGGAWSTVGKVVEKQLMTKLCEMAGVPKEYYNQEKLPKSVREVDFYLFDGKNEPQKCEVKLMGKGNPESADGALARDVKIFVADKLSDMNKQELERKEILWVELRGQESLIKFKKILKELKIPFILDKLD
jgi:hypothetical protein